jgi:hypothetical protein
LPISSNNFNRGIELFSVLSPICDNLWERSESVLICVPVTQHGLAQI